MATEGSGLAGLLLYSLSEFPEKKACLLGLKSQGKRKLQTLRITFAVGRGQGKTSSLSGQMSPLKLSFPVPELSHILRRSSRDHLWM